MTAISVYHGRTTTSNEVNKPIDKCLRHVVPCLTERDLEFVDVRRLSSSVDGYVSPTRPKDATWEREAGQFSTWIPLVWRKFWVRKALWARALSCWKIPRILSEKWNHMRAKHLIEVTSRCKSTSKTIILKVQNNKLRLLTICDASPYHVCSIPSVPLHDARIGRTFHLYVYTHGNGHRRDQRRSVIRHWKAYHDRP